MTNTNLFSTKRGGPSSAPPTDAVNEAGGVAYVLSARAKLAQYVATGTFNNTFYVTDKDQLETLRPLLTEIATDINGELFIAQCAWWGRHCSHMKDMPAFLVAFLGCRGAGHFELAFETVIDNGRMLRNFVQMVRSGALGRRSFGSRMKRAVQRWFERRDARTLLNASVGNQPSLADVIKMVHPRPKTWPRPKIGLNVDACETQAQREGLYGYLIGHARDGAVFPEIIQQLEEFRTKVIHGMYITKTPDVHYDLITSMPLTPAHWKEIALRAGHQWLRMNLKTMARHGVFQDFKVAEVVAQKLGDPREVTAARQLPYQYLTSFNAVSADIGIPPQVKNALQTAMDFACENIPELPAGTIVGVDISPSMDAAITGDRGSATSVVTCKEVASLFAAAILKKCPTARIMPFADTCHGPRTLNPRDSLPTLSGQLSSLTEGGTRISSVLAKANAMRLNAPLVIYLSDNQSWLESTSVGRQVGPLFEWNTRPTETMVEWDAFVARNRGAKLVMVDLAPSSTTQTPERHDVLNVGGWSDRIFATIANFVLDGANWIDVISGVNFRLDPVVDHA